MPRYTISNTADKKIQADLDRIVAVIKERIDPVSVILFGGFGKGEGSFETIDGTMTPLNDYDLYVVTRGRIGEAVLEDTARECAHAIGRGGEEFCENPQARYDVNRFFHVDLRGIPQAKLSALRPMQRTFELKASPTIYGPDLTGQIPEVTVPVSDAIRLLFNKLHHLLLGRNNDVRIKTIYIYKAYLDVAAALLIAEKTFAATYRERERLFQALDVPVPLKALVAWATEFRMQPAFDLNDLNERWQDAQTWTLWALRRILTRELELPVETAWPTLAKAMYRRLPYSYFAPYLPVNFFPAQYALNIFFVRRARKMKHPLIRPLLRWRDAGLILGIAMCLYHAGAHEECRMYLNKIEKISRDRSRPVPTLRDQLLELYGLYYSQRIV